MQIFYHCAPALWNTFPHDLRQFSNHCDSSKTITLAYKFTVYVNTFLLSMPLLLKKFKLVFTVIIFSV